MKKKIILVTTLVLAFFMCLYFINLNKSYAIYRDTLNTKVYLSVLDSSDALTVNFNTMGGSAVSPYKRELNEEIGALPETEKDGENFIGWFTDPYEGTKVNPYDLVTGNVTYYAHWAKIVCKKAEEDTRHQEKCISSGGCKASGMYDANVMITYGTLAGSSIPVTGNAYDCDVDNDGDYDSTYERFYYIRANVGENVQNAVLVHYTSFDKDGQMDNGKGRGSYEYAEAISYLPDTTLWDNPSLQHFDMSLDETPLIKAARVISTTDLYEACGQVNSITAVNFATCQYFLETSRFQSKDLGRAGIWIERVQNNDTYEYYRIQTQSVVVASVDNTSANAARPVIEIPFNTIDGYKERASFNVTFMSLGGSHVPTEARYDGQEIGELPIPTRDGFKFEGWFTDLEDETTKATADTLITSNITFYAKWIEITDGLDYVFYIPGKCTFNGSGTNISSATDDCKSTINPTNNEINYVASSNKYIDTGVKLYTEENIEKDYEIGFTIDSYVATDNIKQATLMNTKLEGNNYPGVVFRRYDEETTRFDLSSRRISSENARTFINYTAGQQIKIYRIYNADTKIQEIYYSVDDGEKVLLTDLSAFNPQFSLNVWFGATPKDVNATSAQRYFVGTLSNIYIRLEQDKNTKAKVTFNAHHGTAEYSEKEVKKGTAIGELPTATKSGYTFDGWYTGENGTGTKLTTATIINSDITYHAYYKENFLVTFDGRGGTVSISPNTIEIADGTSIGANNLPTASKDNVEFIGWYTESTGGVLVTGTEAITGETIYYAHYKEYFSVTFVASPGTTDLDPNPMQVLDGASIGALSLPSAELEGYYFEGWYTDPSEGVLVTGTETITQNKTYYARYLEKCTVTFDAGEGTASFSEKTVGKGNAIGELPTGERLGYELEGWYTDNSYNTKVTTGTIVTGTTTYVANWVSTNYVAMIGNTGYETLQAAVTAATSTKTTITLIKNTSENVSVTGGRNVYLDLNGKTVSHPTGSNVSASQVFTVQGSSANAQSTLELVNGTVTSNQTSGMINVNANGILKVGNNATLQATGSRQAIYVDNGTAYINDGATITAASTVRAAVHNKSTNSKTYITGGIITSNGAYAVYNENGTLEVGTKDGTIDTTKPTITGKTYGLIAYTSYKFYDGIIKGKTAAVGNVTAVGNNSPTIVVDTNETKISEIETNAEKVNDTVDGYKRLYLEPGSAQYKIIIDPRGGSLPNNASTIIMVEPGEKVGDLPTVGKGVYTFDGWYDEATDEEVDANTIPTQSTTYYAKWVYVVNNNVVEFDPTPTVQQVYYQNIDTWKLSSTNFPSWSENNKSPNWSLDATENTAMKNNFDNYNCQCTDNQCTSAGTVKCDKPRGYDTGTNEQVNVYLYDTSTSTKGAQVAYAKGTDGKIYNLITNQVYYWELASDTDVHGWIKFTGKRRLIDAGDVLNVRDLGGLPVDTDDDGNIDGYLKYGRLFRGIKLNSSNSITELNNLGITKELDLREANSDTYKLSNYQRVEAQNYYIKHNSSNTQEQEYYSWTRAAVKQAMLDITNQDNPQNIYFHCRIGTDRTGTVAYILEGLLGVPEEERIEDYELSFFYGLIRVHRYHNEKPGSNIGTGKERFTYMHDFMPTNDKIYEWYMAGTTQEEEANDIKLIQKFRKKMIDYINPGPEPNFATDSWDTIIENARDDRSSYKVGDTKNIEMDLNSDGINETYVVRVANNTTPAECKTEDFSQTACGFVIEFTELITTHRMNPAVSGTTIGTGSYGGWESSDMRAFINSTKYLEGTANEIDYSTTGIYNKLPASLKAGIIDTTVISGYGQGEEEHGNYTTIDKLYLLDPKELYGSGALGYLSSQDNERQLDYYSELGVTTTNYQGALKKKVSTNTNDYWWLRSPLTDFNNSFYGVGQSSKWVQRKSQNVYGVSPAFRIAE